MKLLARLCDDIDASPSVRQFLQADPSRLPIWLKFNKVEAPANKSISEWLERFWYDAHASFSLDAPAAGPLSVRYQNQYIAKINPDGSLDIGPSVHNFVLPVDGADIRHISPDGSSAILHRDGQARILQCACFPAGTLVHTPGGTVAIESLKPDDLIMAYDTQTRDTVISQVRQVAKKTWYSLVRVVTPSDTIWATPNHPFYIPALGRYLPADSLRRGVQLLALTGALLTVQGVAAVDTTVSVYNFEVADHHNYYVGAEGVLVHNTNGNCPLQKANLRGEGFDHAAQVLDIVQHTQFNQFLKSLPDDHVLWDFFQGADLPEGADIVKAQKDRVRAWDAISSGSDDASRLARSNPENLAIIDEYLFEYPDRMDAVRSSFTSAGNKQQYIDDLLGPGPYPGYRDIRHRVKGLYQNLDENDDIAGYLAFEQLSSSGNKLVCETQLLPGLNAIGEGSYFQRVYDASNNEFILSVGIIEAVPPGSSPLSWIDPGTTPLVLGEGVPVNMLVTLRQIKKLNVTDGSLRSLKMSTIQNRETMLWLTRAMKDNGWTNINQVPGDLIMQVGSVNYGPRAMKQAGYRSSNARLVENHDGDLDFTAVTYGQLIDSPPNIFLNFTEAEVTAAGLTRNDIAYFNFNIYFDLTPF